MTDKKKASGPGTRSGWCNPSAVRTPSYDPHLRCTWGDTCPCECHALFWQVTWVDWEDAVQEQDGWATEADATLFATTLVRLQLAPPDSYDVASYRAS